MSEPLSLPSGNSVTFYVTPTREVGYSQIADAVGHAYGSFVTVTADVTLSNKEEIIARDANIKSGDTFINKTTDDDRKYIAHLFADIRARLGCTESVNKYDMMSTNLNINPDHYSIGDRVYRYVRMDKSAPQDMMHITSREIIGVPKWFGLKKMLGRPNYLKHAIKPIFPYANRLTEIHEHEDHEAHLHMLLMNAAYAIDQVVNAEQDHACLVKTHEKLSRLFNEQDSQLTPDEHRNLVAFVVNTVGKYLLEDKAVHSPEDLLTSIYRMMEQHIAGGHTRDPAAVSADAYRKLESMLTEAIPDKDDTIKALLVMVPRYISEALTPSDRARAI